MSDYGKMTGLDGAIEFVLLAPDNGHKEEVLNRLRYERDKKIPVPAKENKTRTWTEYVCGNCGHTLGAAYHYCAACGFPIKWR